MRHTSDIIQRYSQNVIAANTDRTGHRLQPEPIEVESQSTASHGTRHNEGHGAESTFIHTPNNDAGFAHNLFNCSNEYNC